MDEARSHPLPSFAMLMGVGCILCTLVYCISLSSVGVKGCFPLVLTVYGPVLFGVDRLFLRRQRTMLALTALNGAALAALLVLILLSGGYQGWAMGVITLLVCIGPTVQAGYRALEPPSEFSQILTVDIAFLVLLLFTCYTAATDLPLTYCLPICAGCAASLLGLILRRSGGTLHGRGWVMVAAAFACVCALLWVMVSVAAAPAGAGVVRLWEGLVAAVKALGNLVLQLLRFLASLLPKSEYSGDAEMEMEVPDIPQVQEAAEELSPAAGILLAAGGIILAVVLIAMGVRALARLRIGGARKTQAQRPPRRRRPSLAAGLRHLAAAWRRHLALLRWLRQHRESPDGVYFLLVHRCRKASWHKRPGETPREFLTRLSGAVEDDSTLSAALGELASAVDTALYAPCPQAITVPQASLIRRRTAAAVRQQLFRRRTDALLQHLKAVKLPGFQTHNC